MWVKRFVSLLFHTTPEHRCSFCNTSQTAVRQLIAGGPSSYICDECVAICHDIVVRNVTPAPAAAGMIALCLLCKRGKSESECVRVPARGLVWVECVGMVKAVAESS